METKFTKGTWAVEKLITILVNGHEHFCLPIVSNADADEEWAGMGVAVIVWPVEENSPKVREVQKATAHLIKAAPKMYEACENAKDRLDKIASLLNGHLSKENRYEAYCQAFSGIQKIALAEARGEQ